MNGPGVPRPRRSAAAAACVGLTLALGACSLPHERTGDAMSKVAARPAEVTFLLETYNAARRRGDEDRDATVLERVETGPLLDIDAGAYRVRARAGSTESVRPVQLSGLIATVAPRFRRYPMWVGALVDDVGAGTRRFVVFERRSSAAAWLMTASPELGGGSGLPPVAKDDGGAADYVPTDVGDGLAMSPQDAVDSYARAMAGPAAVEHDAFERDAFRRGNAEFRAAQESLNYASFRQRWEAHPVRHAVRLEDGGALVVGTLTRTDTYRVQPGTFIDWEGNAAAKAYLPGRVFSSARLTFRHQVLLSVPERGKVRLLGQYGGVVDGQGS